VLALAATNSDAQPASVIGRLVVQFASGSISNIAVDTSWKAAQFPPANWTQTNFNDSAWTTAESSTSTPWGTPALNDSARVPAPYLRKSFDVAQPITRATVYVTALGAYELHLKRPEGRQRRADSGLVPIHQAGYYQTYDVTAIVHGGANTLGAILGDGWYASNLAFKGQRLKLRGHTSIPGRNSSSNLPTVRRKRSSAMASWKASCGPIQFGDLLLGSGYDARLDMPGWNTTNFN